MKRLHALLAAGCLISAAASCTARDSLLDEAGGSEASSGEAGSASMQAGSPASSGGGSEPKGGTAVGSGGSASGAAAGGSAAGGGPAEIPKCPDGQMWCPGCTVGSGICAAGGCPGGDCEPCANVATQEECDARIGCHSVFLDGNECSCGEAGCCMMFARCADGEYAACEGDVGCDGATPACGPEFVISYSNSCYEGCVAPRDCAVPVCPPVEEPAGCGCYSDDECPAGQHCYSADCASGNPGTCRPPPGQGCFGDVDCPSGQTCIGGSPAPCDSAGPDGIGTCGVEACPEGDCPGIGPSCTCSDGARCLSATGPTGSGQCRGPDGVCSICKCASPDTPIATPHGERRIADLRPGDLVYSVEGEEIRAVPIVRVNRTPVVGHHVLHVTFENGRFIEMTPEHPLADGRPLAALAAGSELMGGAVASIKRVAYSHDATYDILPGSTSGAYFASGVLIGSTLAGAHEGCAVQATPE